MSNKTVQRTFNNRRVSDRSQEPQLPHWIFDSLLSLLLLILSTPVMLLNVVIAALLDKPVYQSVIKKDCLNRPVIQLRFTSGLFRNSLTLWSVLTRKQSFCGMPGHLKLTHNQQVQLRQYADQPTGLFNAVSLQRSSGLVVNNPVVLLEQQFAGTFTGYISLLVRCVLGQVFYKQQSNGLHTPSRFLLFGLKINNVSMQEAVDWVVSPSTTKNNRCKVGCFINVNTVNLAFKHKQLTQHINRADRCFADGSGLRIAAKKIGVNIKENVNGTDLLPHLCEAAIKNDTSIYLLGAAPGIAQATAKNLRKQYPNLRIAGTQHGYFSKAQTPQIIQDINLSKADIVLLAMGSPLQEQWLNKHSPVLNCRSALAVGGLFDFYSGKISRAPLWMRELGQEWVWRLLQEPKAKFTRYVIGNPLFLIRTFVFNLAGREY
jgi:N-acetylglucosaminyldiphosphoundecaprenol N-acetyl-beta-D-mannosaminyltransferase